MNPIRMPLQQPRRLMVARLAVLLGTVPSLVSCSGDGSSAGRGPVDAADTEQTSVSPGVQATPSNPAGAATTSADVASHLDVCLAVRDVAAAIDANPAYLPEAVAVQIFGKLAPETADQVEWLRANADAVARSDCPAELDTVLAQGRIDSLSPIFR